MSRRIDTDYVTETSAENTTIDTMVNVVSEYAQKKLKPLVRTPGHVALGCLTVLVSVLVLKVLAVVISFLFWPLLILSGIGTAIFAVGTALSDNEWEA